MNPNLKSFTSNHFETPLGPMLAVADEDALYLLEFTDTPSVPRKLSSLGGSIASGMNAVLAQLKTEIESYFNGHLKDFKIPLALQGTPFQKSVWHQFLKIPYGQTSTYKAQAELIQRPNAFRAVGSAAGANKIAIIIPCHRVLAQGGSLTKVGAYAGTPRRKAWLLRHEETP